MVKTLINKLINRVRNAACLVITVATIASCKPYINPTINYAPIANLSVSPETIKKGETINLIADGTDENGKSDIIEYKLEIDKNGDGETEETIIQQTPINITSTFDEIGTAKIYASCTDSQGLSNRIEKTATISASNLPTIDLSGIDKDLIDGQSRTINLLSPTDTDTSGEIPYINAEFVSGNITQTLNLNGNQLTINANPISQDGNYKIKLTFGSETGGTNTATLEGIIKNLCDISGTLQSNEEYPNYVGKDGTIKIFDASTNALLGKVPANSTNGFTIQASSPVSSIKLKAQIGIDSYIRTIILDGTKDYIGKIVRAVPAPNFGASKGDFKEFMGRINSWSAEERSDYGLGLNYVNMNSNSGLKKWSLDLKLPEDFQGFEIYSDDFNQTDYDSIKKTILESKHPRAQNIRIERGNNYKTYQGWISVVSRLGQEPGCALYDRDANGYINYATVYLNTLSPDIVIHEGIFHALMASPGHSNSLTIPELPNLPSMGRWTGPSPEVNCLTKGDIKSAYIIDEPTYLGMEKLDDILGMNW